MVDAEKDKIRLDPDALLNALREAGCIVQRPNRIICGFHEDRSPSGGIYQSKQDGFWRFKCAAASCGFNGDIYDVRARAAGKNVAEVLSEANRNSSPASRPQPKRVAKRFSDLSSLKLSYRDLAATYCYTNPLTGDDDLVVLRIEPKGEKKYFQQARSDGKGGYLLEAPPKPWPLYNRVRIQDAPEVLVCEGEKCVEAVEALETIPATTSPAGAGEGKAALADWKPLAGKRIWLWPDNDPPDPVKGTRGGIEHMRAVAHELMQLDPVPTLYWIDPDALGLPPKGDVVDYLDAVGTDWDDRRGALQEAMNAAIPMGAAAEVHALIEDTISGKRSAIPWFSPLFGRMTQALLPGSVAMVCGDPGAGKTFYLLQNLRYWHETNVRVAAFLLEDRRADHVLRLLAQLSGIGNITESTWMTRPENHEKARSAFREFREELQAIGHFIQSKRSDEVTLNELAGWTRQMASAGARVILIDPITLASTPGNRQVEDEKAFMNAAKSAVESHGASLVLFTHPKQGYKKIALDSIAGSAVFPRACQTVAWLQYMAEPKSLDVRRWDDAADQAGERQSVRVNRILWMLKSRNSRHGQGRKLGYWFDPANATYAEQGIVAKEQKSSQPAGEDISDIKRAIEQNTAIDLFPRAQR